MQIALDFSMLNIDITQNPLLVTWHLITGGGWIGLLILFFIALFYIRLYRREDAFVARSKPVLLAIDVPRDSEQSFKAVEQMFAHLHGVHKRMSKWEKYGEGQVQLGFSMEIASIDGYTQFLIRCPEKFRDIAESAVYAQYPDAFITEVEDYAARVNLTFPNPDYDLWGTEFVFTKPSGYPIRTYISFEHSLTQKMIDPMASILETMSNLRPGEQIWLQWFITPIDSSWTEGGHKIVKKIVKAKSEVKKTWTDSFVEFPSSILWEFGQQILPTPIEETKKAPEKSDATIMMHLTPGQKFTVESIENKISKVAFQTKFRFIYLAPKSIFNKKRVLSILGVVKQFSTYNLNGFKNYEHAKVSVDYFKKWREDPRKRKILRAFKARSQSRGAGPGIILNIEELASLYHFPSIEVRAPLIKKSESKRAEPPSTLPTNIPFTGPGFVPKAIDGKKDVEAKPETSVATPPENLPFE